MPPTVKWPTENTAFLVIHGNGPHRQYQTVDKFARKFYEVLSREFELEWKHKLDDRARSYVRFTLPDKNLDKKPYIDFHEYYWDRFMVREITEKELGDWLKDIDDGVDAFAKKGLIKKSLIRSNYNPPLFTLFRILGPFPLLRILLEMRNCLPEKISDFILDKIIGFATDTAIYCLHNQRSSYYEIREKVLKGAVDELEALSKDSADYEQIVVVGHSLGAVIAHDAFNKIARDMIVPNPKLKGWVTFGSFLDVVAMFFQAHVPSLDKPRGIKAWLAKIKDWVPFNSRLDVIANFFQEHVPSPIKRVLSCLFRKKVMVPACQINMEKQITDQRHAFKEKLPTYGNNPVNYGLLKDVKWLNFYHPDDFISNCALIAYEFGPGDAQVECARQIKAGCCKSLLYRIPIVKLFIKFIDAHVKCDASLNVGCWKYVPIACWFKKHMSAHDSYWTNDEMYLKIARKFF